MEFSAAGLSIGSHSARKNLVLYGAWFCPYVQRVWMALEEKSIDYQYVEINPYEDAEISSSYSKKALTIEEKRLRYPSFVEASPRGLVPAISHIDVNVCDSMVCLEYLDEVFSSGPSTSLIGDDPKTRATSRFWAIFTNEKIIPHYYKMLMSELTEGRELAKVDILMGLQELARAMSPDGPFFLGKKFGLVDIVLAPWWQRLIMISKPYRNFEIPAPDFAPEFARLHEWWSAVSTQPSYACTVVDETELVKNYAGYADNSATSDAAQKFR